ncbi:hypothetical protein LINPERHAP2_LOCUS16171, partial [Linum perenne]
MASGSYQGKQKDLPSMFNVKGASLSRTKTLYQAWKDTVDEMENPSTSSPHTPHLTTTTIQTQSNGTSNPSVASQSATEGELEDRIDPDDLERHLGPGFEDDLEENVDLSSKVVRGMTRGLGLHKQFKRTGKKR